MMPTLPLDALYTRGVTAAFGRHRVLNGLDLPNLPAGRIVALLGPNGCGKSTLLKSIAGLIPASCQQLSLGHTDLRLLDATARAESIRYLPQGMPSDVHLTATEAVLVALNARRRLSQQQALACVATTLADLGIVHLSACFLDELSGGQKQLIGLAQALVHQPKVLLLDEPLTALDLNHQHHVMQLLKRLTHERNIITLLVLHDLNSALRYADYALLMRNGALIVSGPPIDVINPRSLADTFSIVARVEKCSQGLPYVLVDDLLRI